jgi:LysM repeat protein
MEQHMTERARDERKKQGLPKNVRQMGNIQGATRIYVEDYVYTYLHGKTDGWAHRGCILLGSRYQDNGQRYLFISGLIRLEEECFTNGIPEFTDMLWGLVYQEMKRFYEDVEILGWGMDVAGASAKLTGDLERIHKNAFQGQDKLIFLMDSLEQEEAFYVYEKNILRRRDGYYIYYEKNPQMREYMMKDQPEGEPVLEEDPQQSAVSSYRRISARNSRRQKSVLGSMVQVASLALLVALSALVVNTLSSTVKMQRLLEAVSYLKADETEVEAAQPDETDVPQVSVAEQKDTDSDEADALDEELPKVMPKDTDAADTENTEQETVDISEADAENADEDGQTDDTEAEPVQEADVQETVEPVAEYYVVEPGESLLGISERFYGKDYTKQLCEINNLEDENKIYAGQKLFLPDADNL